MRKDMWFHDQSREYAEGEYPEAGNKTPSFYAAMIIERASEFLLLEREDSLVMDMLADDSVVSHGDSIADDVDAGAYGKLHTETPRAPVAAMMAIGYAIDAMKTDTIKKDKITTMAWHYVTQAFYYLGVTGESLLMLASEETAIENFARKGALASHKENHDMKAQVQEWYAKNKENYKNMSEATDAAYELKLVPVKHRTLYDWIRQSEKELRSARKM